MPIPVLYIHHAGAFGGASRSLCELIRNFPDGAVKAYAITQRGSASGFLAEAGAEVITTQGISQLDNTRFGRYRGLRWLLLLRETWYAPFTFAALLRARARWKNIAVVHVNEVVALLAIRLAKWIFRCPVVVHVRSVQSSDVRSLRSRMIASVLRDSASAVICIDETVKTSLPPGVDATVVHNSFTPSRAGPAAPGQRRFRAGIVGNLLAFKGTSEFVEAARICRDRGLDIEFVVVGGSSRDLSGMKGWLLQRTGFARDVQSELRDFIRRHRLEEYVRLTGFVSDVNKVYSELDVLCFPSYLDAIGRPVYEAAFWKVPSVVAVSRPHPDTVVHGETGLCIPPRDPKAIADAVTFFYEHPDERKRMGEAALRLARTNFDAPRNARKVLAIYERLLRQSGKAAD